MKEKLKINFLKKKKNEGYFIALLKTNDVLFASWKIDDSGWRKKIEKIESDPGKKTYLYIDIVTMENGISSILESLPVFGLENNWHVFLKNEYSGKRIFLSLNFMDKKGNLSEIMKSSEITLPSIISLQQNMSKREEMLFEISGVNISQGPVTSW